MQTVYKTWDGTPRCDKLLSELRLGKEEKPVR